MRIATRRGHGLGASCALGCLTSLDSVGSAWQWAAAAELPSALAGRQESPRTPPAQQRRPACLCRHLLALTPVTQPLGRSGSPVSTPAVPNGRRFEACGCTGMSGVVVLYAQYRLMHRCSRRYASLVSATECLHHRKAGRGQSRAAEFGVVRRQPSCRHAACEGRISFASLFEGRTTAKGACHEPPYCSRCRPT